MHRSGFIACVAIVVLSIGCAQDATTSPSARIVEASWSFGFCLGPCRGELALDGEALALRVTGFTTKGVEVGSASASPSAIASSRTTGARSKSRAPRAKAAGSR